MYNRSIFMGLLSLFLGLSSLVFASENYTYSNSENLQGYALFVPAGITCSSVLSQEINSKTATVGQSINSILVEDFIYNGSTIAPEGSVIGGSVVMNKKSGFGNRNAKMQIRFTTIRTPYNNIIPISAVVATDDMTGILRGGTALDSLKDYATSTVAGAGSGAISGTIIGAIKGSAGKGAAYGAAMGAAGGVIAGALEKGEDIYIPANSQINLYFDQPITITAQ